MDDQDLLMAGGFQEGIRAMEERVQQETQRPFGHRGGPAGLGVPGEASDAGLPEHPVGPFPWERNEFADPSFGDGSFRDLSVRDLAMQEWASGSDGRDGFEPTAPSGPVDSPRHETMKSYESPTPPGLIDEPRPVVGNWAGEPRQYRPRGGAGIRDRGGSGPLRHGGEGPADESSGNGQPGGIPDDCPRDGDEEPNVERCSGCTYWHALEDEDAGEVEGCSLESLYERVQLGVAAREREREEQWEFIRNCPRSTGEEPNAQHCTGCYHWRVWGRYDPTSETFEGCFFVYSDEQAQEAPPGAP